MKDVGRSGAKSQLGIQGHQQSELKLASNVASERTSTTEEGTEEKKRRTSNKDQEISKLNSSSTFRAMHGNDAKNMSYESHPQRQRPEVPSLRGRMQWLSIFDNMKQADQEERKKDRQLKAQ